MKDKKIENFLQHIKCHQQKIIFGLFITLLLYSLIGCFPVSLYEADGIGVANGIMVMQQQGLGENPFAYRVAEHPGTHILLYLVNIVLHQDVYDVFSILSAFAMVLFVISSTFFISKLTGKSFGVIGIVLLLIQETTASGYYANSTVIACCIVVIGMWILLDAQSVIKAVIAGLLIGFGISCRLEVSLILIPVIFWIILKEKKITRTLFVAGMSAVLALMGVFAIMHITYSDVINLFRVHQTFRNSNLAIEGIPILGMRNIRSYVSFISVSFLLLTISGIFVLFRQKKYGMIFFCIFGIIPFLVIFGSSVVSPKYLYASIPYFAILILYGLELIRFEKPYRFFSIFVGVLFVGQYFFGLQVSLASKPYREQIQPVLVKVLSIPQITHSITEADIVIGSGASLSTDDAYRLTSGLIYAPIFWQTQKAERKAAVDGVSDFIHSQEYQDESIVCVDYDACQIMRNLMLKDGYTLKILAADQVEMTIKDQAPAILYFTDGLQTREAVLTYLNSIGRSNVLLVTTYPSLQYDLQHSTNAITGVSDLGYLINTNN